MHRLSGGILALLASLAGPWSTRAEPCTPIQPADLGFSFYLGGGDEDTVRDIHVCEQGYIYVAGGTASANFPATPRAYDTTLATNGFPIHDAFVAKLNPDGTIVWATYLGGPHYDRAYAIEVDAAGCIFVAGRAGPGFPITPGVVQPVFAGDVNPNPQYGTQDGFVAKLSPDGRQLLWSTYFGGPDRSFIRDIDIDDAGCVYLAAAAVSEPNPHITPFAYRTALAGGEDGVIAKLDPNGTTVEWATYFGGSGTDMATPSIRVDIFRNVYVLGFTDSDDMPMTLGASDQTYNGSGDLYLAKFTSDGAWLLFGTYIGGSQVEFSETHGLAVDDYGGIYVAGTTKSSDYLGTPGAFQRDYAGSGGPHSGAHSNYPGDAFILKLAQVDGRRIAQTYLGGRYGEGLEGLATDDAGNVYVSGATYSFDFPVTADAHQRTYQGNGDTFVAKLSPDLTHVLYASYLGGTGTDYGRAIAIDGSGNVYAAGHSLSTDWPVAYPTRSLLEGSWDGVLAAFQIEAPADFGDLDADGDLDLSDLSFFSNCYVVSSGVQDPGCQLADSNSDGCIDLTDYYALARAITGPRRSGG